MSKKDIFGTPGSIEVGEPAKPGESRARRLKLTADALVERPWEGLDTTYDIITYCAKTHVNKDGVGYREIVDIIEEEKEVTKTVGGKEVKETKKWKYFQLSDYKYLSYEQFHTAITEVSRGLLELDIKKEDVFNVYAATSVEWQLIAHGCATISTPFATAYESLGEEGLTHSLNEPGCVGIFTNAELLGTLLKVAGNVGSLRVVIYDGKPKQDVLDGLKGVREDMQVLHIDELRALGKDKPMDGVTARLPKKDDICTIMYTSGTTGAPKGVVIRHSNLLATVGAIYGILGHQLSKEDSYLAYLPLAHILEFVIELALMFVGMTLGYGRVKTLTDQSVRKSKGDLSAFKPSIMVGVPAVWEMIRKGILQKVASSGTVKQKVFNGAIAVKKAGVPGLTQVVDSAVLPAIKAATGGRLRLALSGGAAISRETQEFLSLALVTLLQGYGMTETCGMCCILPPEKLQFGVAGLPVPAVEIKFLDVLEAGYKAQGNPPQGEICIRGPAVNMEYYKRPDLNNDETIFTKDGWLRTGDVGQWNPDGTMSIIDRIKNLVKLQGGEYIALERLESTYKSCNLVSNICVHADTNAKQPIAIIIPHEGHLRHALSDNVSPLSDLCQKNEVKQLVLKECNAAGKKAAFKSMELLEAVILTPDEWTPESGLVTAAQKVQRKKVAQKFEGEIKEIYKNQ